MCPETTKPMGRHVLKTNPNGLFRHSRVAKAWNSFDQLHRKFALELRNVHIVLAIDGFNPSQTMHNSYNMANEFNSI